MAVDLGNLKNEGTQTDGREPIEVVAAFMVVIRENGAIQASPDINAPIQPEREVTIDEMQMASQKVADDIQASKIAQIVQAQMAQTAAVMREQQNNQRLAQSLNI